MALTPLLRSAILVFLELAVEVGDIVHTDFGADIGNHHIRPFEQNFGSPLQSELAFPYTEIQMEIALEISLQVDPGDIDFSGKIGYGKICAEIRP